MDDVATRFASGWVVTDGDRPLFGTDPDRPGIVTPLLPDRRTAVSLASIVADGDDAWTRRLGVASLGEPQHAMRAFAACGVVGWSPQGRWDGGTPPRVRFSVRPHEVGAPMPTVIASGDRTTGWHALFPSHGHSTSAPDVVPWVRYDVTDRAAITFRDGMPLGQVGESDPLFEVRGGGKPVILRDDPVVGPWGVAGGVVQLVSDLDVANRQCEALARTLGGGVGPYQVAEVPDLAARLDELVVEASGAMVTVNSGGHREYAAIAYPRRPEGVVPRWWDRHPRIDGPVLRGPGGIWMVRPGNRFDLVAEAEEWSGCDTFFWSGSGSGSGPKTDERVTVSWWEVRQGPVEVQTRACDDIGAAVRFVADVVEATSGVAQSVVSAVRSAIDNRLDVEAFVRLVNLSRGGVFVEGVGGGR
jgi:hypothetical protein